MQSPASTPSSPPLDTPSEDVGHSSPDASPTASSTPPQSPFTPSPTATAYDPGAGDQVDGSPSLSPGPSTPSPTHSETPPQRWSDDALGTNHWHLDGQYLYEGFGAAIESVSSMENSLVAIASPGRPGTHASHGRVTLFSPPTSEEWGDSPRLTLVAENSATGAGYSLSSGDLNGDGQGDLVVGAPHSNKDAGASYLLLNLNAPPVGASLTLETEGLAVAGDGGGLLGFSTALGDLDGDGFEDAALGEPSAGENWGGQAQVVFGRKDLGPAAPPKADLKVSAQGDGYLAGYSLGIGDVTGGGLKALALGAPGAPGLETEGAGAVALFGGRLVWPDALTLDDADLLLMGESPGGRGSAAGSSLVIGCDLDGDSLGDLVVGAPDFGVPEGPDRGRVYILRGGSGLRGAIPLSVSDARITGELPGDRLGETLACAGDLNNDGAEDLLVSAPGAEGRWGVIYIMWGGPGLFGPTGGPEERSTVLHAERPNTQAGKALGVTSHKTLLIGAPRTETAQGGAESGRVYAYTGD